MLSSDEIEFFWRNGYCRIGRVLSRGEALVTRRRVEQFEVAHPEAIGKLALKDQSAVYLVGQLVGASEIVGEARKPARSEHPVSQRCVS